ncbi:hypothetical protein [Methylobacterium sp. JK268]
MNTLLVALLTAYAAFALVKPVFLFALRYDRRRIMLDRSYAGRARATARSDVALIGLCLVLVALLMLRGAEPVSFLTGLLVGMTLIQVYFHRYSVPLTEREAPPPPVSPIKTLSYAIQAAPGRAWIELALIAALVVWSLVGMLA